MAAAVLIDDPKYGWLKKLGLQSVNDGAFVAGQWCGSDSAVGCVCTRANTRLLQPLIESVCPANNRVIARVRPASLVEYDRGMDACARAWQHWADVPAPARGEIVRQIGDKLRAHLNDLGQLVCVELPCAQRMCTRHRCR
jgi:aldehyde dehydrogenase family 7 protein A1